MRSCPVTKSVKKSFSQKEDSSQNHHRKVRLDKWLWAARFFKTRNLSKQAIEGGKVHYNGTRSKVSKDVEIGCELRIRHGGSEKTITVIALSDKRRGAPEAQALYQETHESIEKRQQYAIQSKQINQSLIAPDTKPSKKDRRLIHQFKEKNRE